MCDVFETLHGYTIGKLIGKGQYGPVHVVIKEKKQFAMKKISLIRELAGTGMNQTTLALNELSALKTINNHPFIVRYVELFQDKSLQPCIVMELCGDNFKKLITTTSENRCSFSEQQIRQWIVQLALALCHVHGKLIMHRELKPNNVFLTDKGAAKLGDFSLVKMLSPDASIAVTKGRNQENYRAPEMWQGHPYHCNADVWALGCFMYELMTLKPPFSTAQGGGGHATLMQKVVKAEYEPIPPNRYSASLVEVMKTMLDPNPETRPCSLEVLYLPDLIDCVGDVCQEYSLENPASAGIDCYEAEKEDTGDDEFLPVECDEKGRFPLVKWATANPQSQSRLIWQTMVSGEGGTLQFPPLILPKHLSGLTILLRFVRRDALAQGGASQETADVNAAIPFVPKKDMRFWVQLREACDEVTPILKFKICVKIPLKNGGMHQYQKGDLRMSVSKKLQILHCQQIFPWERFDQGQPPTAEVQIQADDDAY